MLIPQRTKRKRGVILSESGWQRLQYSKRQSEILNNGSIAYTLEELVKITHLSQNTLIRIHNRTTAVDRHSLQSYFKAFDLAFDENDYINPRLQNIEYTQQNQLQDLVPLNSPFDIEFQPIEQLCYKAIMQPGSLISIKAPALMGKTSLMSRILCEARTHGMKTVTLSFQLADSTVFTDLNRFLQWFCAVVSQGLKLPLQLTEYWDDIFGANYNCTYYFENYLLANSSNNLVLALDNVDILFRYPEIATNFFSLLRAWHEKCEYGDESSNLWQKLRLILVFSTEVGIPLDFHQPLLNLGLSVELPKFISEQICV